MMEASRYSHNNTYRASELSKSPNKNTNTRARMQNYFNSFVQSKSPITHKTLGIESDRPATSYESRSINVVTH